MGRKDFIMRFDQAEGREEYSRNVRSIVPHAELFDRDFDHFGRGVEHEMVIEHLSDIFERYDSLTPTASAPPSHLLRETVGTRSCE
jgi:hypothetical protein